MIPWWIKFVAVALVLGTTGFAGWKLRDNSCDAAAAKAEVAALRKSLDAANAAAKQDQLRAKADADARADLEGVVRDLESKVSSGECFGPADTDELRKLWR